MKVAIDTQLLNVEKKIETITDEKINNNFLGWPTDTRLGGLCISHLFDSDQRISPIDWHPNQKGQIKITEYIYDRLG